MYKEYRNNFRYTDESILDIKTEAIVLPVDMRGYDISYPIVRPFPEQHRRELNEWRMRARRDLEPAQTKLIKNEMNEYSTSEWVIYTILPYYNDSKDWFILCDCYRNCLNTAAENGITSVAFPFMGGGRIYYRPESDLLFYVSSAINEAVSRLGGPEKMEVTVQLPHDLYECVVRLEDMTVGRSGTVMPLPEAKKWIELFDHFITNDIAADKSVFDIPPWKARAQALTYDVEKYVKAYLNRREYIDDLVNEHRSAALYESIVSKIKKEKADYIAETMKKEPDADPDDIVKHFRCKQIDDVIQKWCDKPVRAKDREKYGRQTNNRSQLAKMIGASSQYFTNISGGNTLPSRNMLLSMAAAMKLPYEERTELILYREEDMKYPSSELEKYVERCFAETGYIESNMSFKTFNDEYVYERSGHKFNLYKCDADGKNKENNAGRKKKVEEK